MKFKTYKTKDRERVRVDTEYYSDGRKVTIHIKLWLVALILITVLLGLTALIA